MDTINLRRISAGEDPYSILEYLLQYFVRQLIYFIPFIFIIKFCKKISDLEYVINTLVLSIGLLAIFIIYSYLFGIEDRSSMEVVGETTSLIGLHRNAVADFFIAGFPIILARYFLKKNIINILVVWLSVVAIGFLYSRTAYGLLILSTVLYFYVSRRIKFSPLLIAIAIGLFFIIPSTIINRASKGLEVRDQEEVTSRIDHIWRPLIEEYAGDLKGLLFGRGRYAMLSSNAVATGLTPTTMMHPHNMYLEQILDVGIIGLVCMIWLFAILFRKVHRTLGTIQDYKLREYRCGMIVSIASYFIAGVTGRSFFPQLKNSFFWIIVGMTFVLIKLIQKSHENEAVLKHISVGEIRHPGSVQEKRFA
jgi:O-antigen ligase